MHFLDQGLLIEMHVVVVTSLTDSHKDALSIQDSEEI
jgi:hypothetical protein